MQLVANSTRHPSLIQSNEQKEVMPFCTSDEHFGGKNRVCTFPLPWEIQKTIFTQLPLYERVNIGKTSNFHLLLFYASTHKVDYEPHQLSQLGMSQIILNIFQYDQLIHDDCLPYTPNGRAFLESQGIVGHVMHQDIKNGLSIQAALQQQNTIQKQITEKLKDSALSKLQRENLRNEHIAKYVLNGIFLVEDACDFTVDFVSLTGYRYTRPLINMGLITKHDLKKIIKDLQQNRYPNGDLRDLIYEMQSSNWCLTEKHIKEMIHLVIDESITPKEAKDLCMCYRFVSNGELTREEFFTFYENQQSYLDTWDIINLFYNIQRPDISIAEKCAKEIALQFISGALERHEAMHLVNIYPYINRGFLTLKQFEQLLQVIKEGKLDKKPIFEVIYTLSTNIWIELDQSGEQLIEQVIHLLQLVMNGQVPTEEANTIILDLDSKLQSITNQ